jgi:hypothetical protein
MDELQISACAPGTVNRADSVCIPACSPIVRSFVAEIGNAGAEAVLWGDASDSDVQRMAGEKLLSAVGNFLEVAATTLEFVPGDGSGEGSCARATPAVNKRRTKKMRRTSPPLLSGGLGGVRVQDRRGPVNVGANFALGF